MTTPNQNFGLPESEILRRRQTLRERMLGAEKNNQPSETSSFLNAAGSSQNVVINGTNDNYNVKTTAVKTSYNSNKLKPIPLENLDLNSRSSSSYRTESDYDPAIPLNYLSEVNQRKMAFGVAIILQIMKLLLLFPNYFSDSNVAIGSAPIPFLGYFISKIPIFSGSNTGYHNQPDTLPNPGKKLDIGLGSRKPIDFNKLMHDSNLGGSYTVKILPDSMVIVNQNKTAYCINMDESPKELSVPIFINGTNPTKLTYTFIPINGKKPKEVTLKLNNFFKSHQVDSDSKLAYGEYHFKVNSPGSYVDIEVHDNEGSLYQHFEANLIDIAPCPKAEIPTDKITFDHCLNGEDKIIELPVKASGVPPLKLMYAYKYGNTDNEFKEIITSEESSNEFDKTKEHIFAIDRIVPIKVNLHKLGGYDFRLISIQDRLGNFFKYDSYKAKKVTYNLHPLPSGDFKCTPESYKLSPKHEKVEFPLHLTGQPKFNVSIRHCPDAAKDIHSSSCRLIDLNDKQIVSLYRTKEPGSYTLIQVKDQFCIKDISDPTTCMVEHAAKPTVAVEFQPYFGNCNRVVGLDVHMDLTGQPPFDVVLKTNSKINQRVSANQKTFTINSNHHILPIRPEESGEYTYELTKLMSHDYGEIKLNERYKQHIEALPNAKFVTATRTLKTCLHQSVDPKHYQVALTGSGPFTLNYSSVHRDAITHQPIAVAENLVTLDLPTQFDSAGRHSFQLSKITDEYNCENLLENQVLNVMVREKPPQARFECGNAANNFTLRTLASHEVNLPVHLTGEPPFELNYIRPDGMIKKKTVPSSSYDLKTNQEGTYVLDSLRDASCIGKINDEKSYCNVEFFAKPQLALAPNQFVKEDADTYVKRGVCLGDNSYLDLKFIGLPPFKLWYLSADAHKNATEKHVQFSDNSVRLPLDTDIAGEHRYELEKYGDQRYSQLPLSSRQVVIQQVYPQPNLAFDDLHPIQLCSTNLTFAVYLHYTGTASYHAKLALFEADQLVHRFSIHIATGEKSSHLLSLAGLDLRAGTYKLRITEVTDSHNCHSFVSGNHTELELKLTYPPNLLPSSNSKTHDLCIGDRLQFQLQGTPPFNMKYQFEGNSFDFEEPTHQFSGTADQQGTFKIKSVCHLASQLNCCSQPEFKTIVHPLPKAILGEGNDNQVKLRGGQDATLKINLYGTPPFAFTYIRMDLKTNKVVETQTITEVLKEVYVIKTRLPGIYKVTEIKDKHCSYPPRPNWST